MDELDEGCGCPVSRVVEGLAPAFLDTRTGETRLAAGANGEPSSVHEFTSLPPHWVIERDADGEPVALHPAIVAGYRRFDRFLPAVRGFAPPLDA